MEICALSLNHRVTPLAIRESVAFDEGQGTRFLAELKARPGLAGAFLLSTCNRTEVYALSESSPAEEIERALFEDLRRARAFEPSESPRNYEVFRQEEAVRHLFRVASGLDSQILGESQILAQVKEAFAWAQTAGAACRPLQRLWEHALRAGKRVRAETAIGQGPLSASYAALELARKVFGSLAGKRALVIGAGEIAGLVLADLEGVRLGGLSIMNRTRSVAEELARRHGARVRELSELFEALVEADLVVSSTGSREPIVRYDLLRRVRQERGGDRPLLVVDLAVPRDFEEACAAIDGVFLKNLDDLFEIADASAAERKKEIPKAEAIVEREVASFYRWLRALEVEPTIRKLREILHAIRSEELSRLGGQLGGDALGRVERFSERLVNRILHVISKNLRRHEGLRDHEVLAAIHRLLTEEIPEGEGGRPGEGA